MQSPFGPFVKRYTKVFYMNYEGNVTSIQCKTGVDRLSLMEETDGLSFNLVDFYVPSLAPRPLRSKAACNVHGFKAAEAQIVTTQPPIQWVPWALSPVIKRLGREADHSLLSSVKSKNTWS
jgi:hypothetical protein